MKTLDGIATLRETGRKYFYARRQSWGKVYYSFDHGDTWHASKADAYRVAEANGRLTEYRKVGGA